MESFKDLLGADGHSSSESGWTMYFSSHIEEEDDKCSDNHDGDCHDKRQIRNRKYVKKKEDDGSDDSLTSDASSVPSTYIRHTGHSHAQGSHDTSRSKPDKTYNENTFSFRKDAKKQEKKLVGSSTKK